MGKSQPNNSKPISNKAPWVPTPGQEKVLDKIEQNIVNGLKKIKE